MFLPMLSQGDLGGWRAVNQGDAVTVGWVQANDGPTDGLRGYLSASATVANGSVAADVPKDEIHPLEGQISTQDARPGGSTHTHDLTVTRSAIPSLSFSVWLRAPGLLSMNVAVALWRLNSPHTYGGDATYAFRPVTVTRQWRQVQVIHGPYPAVMFARCELYLSTINRTVHVAGPDLH